MLKWNYLQQLKSTYVRKYVVGVGCKEEGSVKSKKSRKHDNQLKLKRSAGKYFLAPFCINNDLLQQYLSHQPKQY